jgi:hypothetical protein
MATNIWSYAGQAGKRLSETARPFANDSAFLDFNSMGVDRWTWSVPLLNFIPSSEEYPEEGQLVTLYRSGQRFFRGTALRPDQNDFSMSLAVVSPWHWLEKIPLTSSITLDAASGGGAGLRTTIGFPAQSMTTSLGALIDRCIALGAPMIKGTIPTTFACIPVTVNNGSCADAITTLVRMIGDLSVWFDYSTGSGHPIINITRRLTGVTGSATVVTLNPAVQVFTPGQFKVVSQDDQRVSQVRVPFLDRAANGARRYQEQKAGSEEVGHVLILTASGKELDTFLPEEKLDSYLLKTVPTSGTAFKNWVLGQDGNIVNAATVAGMPPSSLPLLIGPATLTYATMSSLLPTLNKSVPIPATSFTDEAGNPVSTSGMSLLVSDQLPEWLKNSYTVVPVKVTGAIYYDFKVADSSNPLYPKPNWWFSISWAAADTEGFRGPTTASATTWELFIHTFEIRGFLINATSPGGTTVYKPADYTFIQPPAGFAAGLLAARNWTPYKGSVALKEQDCGSTRYMGKVVNITGADPELETMRAMVASERLDLKAGTTRLTFGPPARIAYRTLLEAVRPNPNEQIVYL